MYIKKIYIRYEIIYKDILDSQRILFDYFIQLLKKLNSFVVYIIGCKISEHF